MSAAGKEVERQGSGVGEDGSVLGRMLLPF